MLNQVVEIFDGGLADFSLCVPSRDAYNGYVQFNYKNVGTVPYYVLCPDLKGYLGRTLRLPVKCDLRGFGRPRLFSEYYMNNPTCDVQEVGKFPPQLTIMPQYHATHVMMRRDPRYLEWRYINHPWHKYRIFVAIVKFRYVGYAIVRGINIIDIWAQKINWFRDLLAAVIDEYVKVKCMMVHLYLQSTREHQQVLSEAGFIRYRMPIRIGGTYPQQTMMIRCNPNGSCDQSILDLSKYYMTTGDVALGL
jgi:hypothetical protein